MKPFRVWVISMAQDLYEEIDKIEDAKPVAQRLWHEDAVDWCVERLNPDTGLYADNCACRQWREVTGLKDTIEDRHGP